MLARTAHPAEAGKDVLIETRGEGGLVMCAPSPGYLILQGELTNIRKISDLQRIALIEAARSLNEIEKPFTDSSPLTKLSDGTEPGDDFNSRGDVPAILSRHGWRMLRDGDNQQWCRPGKQDGCSATLKDGVFFVFSSNARPFEPNRAYAPFAVFAMLEHAGDFASATRALAVDGFGATDFGGVDLSNFKVSSEQKQSPHTANAIHGVIARRRESVPCRLLARDHEIA